MSQSRPRWMQEYDSVEDLHEQVQRYYDEISERLDAEVAENVDVSISPDDEQVTLVCERDDDAPQSDVLGPVRDVCVDAIQSAGRRMEAETDLYNARDSGTLVVSAPLKPNPLGH